MQIQEIKLTKARALSLYKGTLLERETALARDLGMHRQIVHKWPDLVPRWWAIIITQLLHPEKFKVNKKPTNVQE